MPDIDLPALVSSRICHDLISPIGAIGNGVELMSELNAGASSPELALVGDSVNAAAQKLRVFRMAFGAAPRDAAVSTAELGAAIRSLFSGRAAVALDLPDEDLPRLTAKAALLALLCQERCLPLGGDTRLSVSAAGFAAETAAPRIRDAESLWAVVENGAEKTPDIAPSEVQFLLLGQLLRDTGARFARQAGPDRLSLSVSGLRP